MLVGCEPASFGEADDGRMALSDEVRAAVASAAALALSLVADWRRATQPASVDATAEETVQ